MKYDVFISYSSKDIEVALIVCKMLEEHDIKCWMAPINIPSGVEYEDLVVDAIIASKVFLFIYSFGSVYSDWCKMELKVAFSEKKTIISYNIDTTPMNRDMKMILNKCHLLDAYPDYKSQFTSLVETINSSLGKSMVPSLTPFKSTPSKEKIYKIGDFYDEKGKKGVVFEVSADGKHGKIVSLIKSRLTSWRLYDKPMVGGCDDKRDGYVNMQKIKKIPKWQEEFFAFAWCANLGEEWYLPATEELKSIYIAKPKINSTISAIINSTLSANGCNILDDYDYYWSSVEENVYCSCVVSMNDGCINANFAKDGISYVRAVSAF